MPPKRGISILDLIGVLPAGAQTLIPADIETQLEKLTVLEYRSTTTDDVHIHYGTVQSIADGWLPSLRNWPVELPLLNAGVPFQMVRSRAPKGTNTLEPAATSFFIDLFLNRIAITIPGLKPAKLVPGAGQTAAHLVPDAARDTVRIVGGGTLRLLFPATGGPQVLFVSTTDGLDPKAPTGVVIDLSFDPPQFFLGGSDIGLRVDRLTYDDSVDFTPAEIIARQQGPEWRGIAIKEATAFLPRNARWIGDLNVGVRDVLLGSPMGLQGEIHIEFGNTPVHPAGLTFFQAQPQTVVPSGEIPIKAPQPTTNDKRTLVLDVTSTGEVARVRATAPPPPPPQPPDAAKEYTYFWTLPDGSTHLGDAVDFFDVRDQDVLRVQPIEKASDETAAVSPSSAVWFAVKPPAPDLISPVIHVTLPGVQFQGKPLFLENVAFASGKAEALNRLVFSTAFGDKPEAVDLVWKVGVGGSGGFGVGKTFTPDLPDYAGPYDLVVGRLTGLIRRARLEVLPQGGLIIGAASGVWRIVGTAAHPMALLGVESTFKAFDFHPDGVQLAAAAPASLDANNKVQTIDGSIAVVTVKIGTKENPDGDPPPDIPAPETIKELHVLMNFGTTEEYDWGDKRLAEPFSIEALRKWAEGFVGGEFHITGRTCDIGTVERNTQLAAQRAERGKFFLTDPALPGPAANPDFVEAAGEIPDQSGKILIHHEHPELSGDNRYLPPRPAYRRIEFVAKKGQPLNVPVVPSIDDTIAPVLRRAFVPGKDATTVLVAQNPEPARPFRVRLVVRWDSPTVASLSDAIPTLAELLISWQKTEVVLPGLKPGNPDQKVTPDGPDTFTLVGRWSYDSRSSETMFSLSFNNAGSPDGLFSVTNNTAATALALGPALISGLSAMDTDSKAVHIGALLGACAFATTTNAVTNGKVVFHGITIEEKQRSLTSLAGSRQRLLFDYTAQVGFQINTGVLQVKADKPIKIRYKNASLEIDHAKSGFDRFGIVYDQCSFDIEDPGQWTIAGPLGKLLRVTGTRAGSGSTWMEVDLAFCLDLDTVKITNATIRVNFPTGNNTFGVELRGLGVAVDIPGALKGGGRLAIGKGGKITAGLDIDIIPAKVTVRGGLALDEFMCSLELGLLLPVGIPLGSSGLGLYGFLGRFVSNGKRQLDSAKQDPVEREIAWYRQAFESKYGKQRGQWALGLGAVIGTLPDTGFTFNALGMLTIAFPDPEVIFSVDAKLLQKPSMPKEQGDGPVTGLELLGIMVFSEHAYILGIRGTYTIPNLLTLEVPISGFFPFQDLGSSYFRIGADGVGNRKGEPVSITVFPGILDLKAWAYLMVEASELHNLGNRGINLDGFSIGFGTGFALNWSAGPIKLSASAEMMVGLGTKPFTLAGHIGVRGELSIIIISLSAAAEIDAVIKKIPPLQPLPPGTQAEDHFYWELDGFVEATIDLLFFQISGRVDVHLDNLAPGASKPPDIPTPDHPLRRIDLTDRNGVITGRATGGEEPASDLPTTVWPDTVPLLHFSHFVQNGLSGSAFTPQPAVLDGQEWSGTANLKYAYRLKNIRILKKGGAELPGPLDSVWWWPTHRGGVLKAEGPSPSEHESRLLALLSWHPCPWSRNRTDGGADTPADPAETLENICKPSPAPVRNIANAQNFIRTGADSIQFAPLSKGASPFPSFFTCRAKETGKGTDLVTYKALLAEVGQHLELGRLRQFGGLTPIPSENQALTGCYELGYVASQKRFVRTTQFETSLDPSLVEPALMLAVWEDGDKVICDYFEDLGPKNPAFILPRDGVTYLATGTMQTGQHEILITGSGMRITFPVAVQFVTLTLISDSDFSGISVRGRNANLSVVFDKEVSGRNHEPFTITLANLGIKMLDLTPGVVIPKLTGAGPGTSGQPSLAGVCWAAASSLASPVVTGVRSNGSTAIWSPQVVGTASISGAVAPARLIRYTPPQSGTWSSVRMDEYTGGHAAVLSISGIPWMADKLAKGNEITKQQIKNQMNNKALSKAPEKKTLIEANTAYEIHVECQWQGWKKSDDGKQQPDPPAEDAWQKFPQPAVFSFQTAAAAVLQAPLPPVDFKNETIFDPRGIARYIIGVRPDGNGTPHFLDDPVYVDFAIDHLEQLLAAYGRKLLLKLRRTDQGVHAVPGFGTPPDITSTKTIGPLPHHLKSKADQYFLESFTKAPCMEAPDIGGQSIGLSADLQPNAEYDLLLVAAPANNPNSDDVLVYRSHFRTSRYRNPGEMLKAIGFLDPERPYAVLPHDAILAVPSTSLSPSLENDTDFDAALRTLQLDPWPLSPDPRTVVLWQQNGSGYQLAGVMLEHNEPMVRDGRMNLVGVSLQVGKTTGKQALVLTRSNAAGTRALLLPAAPLTVSVDDRLELTFADNSSQIKAYRFLHTTPRMVYEEVL